MLEEILRVRLPLRPDVLLRWQKAIRTEIAPALEAAEQAQTTTQAPPRDRRAS